MAPAFYPRARFRPAHGGARGHRDRRRRRDRDERRVPPRGARGDGRRPARAVPRRVRVPAGVAGAFPELRVDDVAGGLLVEEAGFCDPHSVAAGYALAAKRRGVRVRPNAPVEQVLLEGRKVVGVQTPDGAVRAPVVVNAAGPWANDVNRTAGVELPLTLWQRHVFVTTPHPEIPADRPIYVARDGRFYFREGSAGGCVIGLVEDRAPPADLA